MSCERWLCVGRTPLGVWWRSSTIDSRNKCVLDILGARVERGGCEAGAVSRPHQPHASLGKPVDRRPSVEPAAERGRRRVRRTTLGVRWLSRKRCR